MAGRVAFLLAVLCAAGAASALAAGSDPRDPQKRHNAADQSWARAIRIQRSDLGAGDWRIEPDEDDRNSPKECRDPDLSDLVETGGAENPNWSRNGSVVGTSVGIFASSRQATTAWKRLARQRINQCLVKALEYGLQGTGLRLKVLSVGTPPVTKLTPLFHSSRIRVTLLGPQHAKVDGRVSYYLYSRGRATVLFFVSSFGRPLRPIPESLESRLATLVAARLKR
jgi:hypothetical protein